MEQNVIQKNMGTPAGMYGLVLGLISAGYLLITQWLAMSDMPAALMIFLNMALWVLKAGGCIWVMFLFIRQMATDFPQANRNALFKGGMVVSILSALVYSAFTFANIAYFYPEFFAEQMDTIMQQFAPYMDSNTASQMEKTMQSLPQIAFFSNLIYCFGYGTILSFIISRYIPMQESNTQINSDEQ